MWEAGKDREQEWKKKVELLERELSQSRQTAQLLARELNRSHMEREENAKKSVERGDKPTVIEGRSYIKATQDARKEELEKLVEKRLKEKLDADYNEQLKQQLEKFQFEQCATQQSLESEKREISILLRYLLAVICCLHENRLLGRGEEKRREEIFNGMPSEPAQLSRSVEDAVRFCQEIALARERNKPIIQRQTLCFECIERRLKNPFSETVLSAQSGRFFNSDFNSQEVNECQETKKKFVPPSSEKKRRRDEMEVSDRFLRDSAEERKDLSSPEAASTICSERSFVCSKRPSPKKVLQQDISRCQKWRSECFDESQLNNASPNWHQLSLARDFNEGRRSEQRGVVNSRSLHIEKKKPGVASQSVASQVAAARAGAALSATISSANMQIF